MGPGKYENVGKSQSVLVMINPMISPRTPTSATERLRRRSTGGTRRSPCVVGVGGAAGALDAACATRLSY
jgi:hypothetical protein